ncbi:hypothetical protein DSO57_1000712 [Entomophthora muscae]|uniref:Uncharacterized protein n=1 Tax=Entomophthora muscae TaxID=34485 RepID=A0ACC2SM05_9FUNG|nr:hypothetical protein DSO57_1000712 [Entomophthora muscae]
MDTSKLAGAVVAMCGNVLTTGAYHPWYYRLLRMGMPKYYIDVYLENEFESVETCFRNNFEKGLEVGASVTVYSHGRKVVDIQGGFTDLENSQVLTEQTLMPVFSTVNVIEAIVIARLVDEGRLSYDDTVASIWPDFGKGKKNRVTVANVMCHEAGIPYFSDTSQSIDFSDPTDATASQNHHFGGYTTRSYHGLIRSWILDGIVQRVDYRGRTLCQIYEEDLNSKLGMEFFTRLDSEADKRRSPWHSYPMFDNFLRYFWPSLKEAVGEDHIRTMLNSGAFHGNLTTVCETLGPEYGNVSLSSSIYIPSSNCFTNSYSLATIGACLANQGSLDETKLLSSATLDKALGGETKEFDLSLFTNTTMTQGGFGVFTFEEIDPEIKFYGWTGFGGSLMLFSPQHNFSFSYVTNSRNLRVMIGSRARRLLISAFKSHQQAS